MVAEQSRRPAFSRLPARMLILGLIAGLGLVLAAILVTPRVPNGATALLAGGCVIAVASAAGLWYWATATVEGMADLRRQLRVLRDRGAMRSELEADITRIAQQVRQPQSLDAVLERTVRELGFTLPATEVVVSLTENTDGYAHAVWDTSGRVHVMRNAEDDALDEAPLIHATLSSGDVLAIDDVGQHDFGDEGQMLERLRRHGVYAVLATPILSGMTALGAIVVHAGRPGHWPESAHRLLRAVARELAAAVLHTRVQSREREMIARLETLDGAQRDFVASVSDVLRAPLASIAGSLETLAHDDAARLEMEQRRALRVAQISAERLTVVLEGLITLTRVDSPASALSFVPVRVRPMLESLRRFALQLRGDRNLSLFFEDPGEDLAVMGNEPQVYRALANVVDNALKFTPDGGDVRVSALPDDEVVRFVVDDTGIGMSDEERPNKVTRWLRARRNVDTIEAGGIGLLIVKSIVDRHDGALDVRSMPGAGTTVTLSFPRATLPLEADD